MDRTTTNCDYIIIESVLSTFFFMSVFSKDNSIFSLVFFIASGLALFYLVFILHVRRMESHTAVLLIFGAVITGENIFSLLMLITGGGFVILLAVPFLLLLVPLMVLKSIFLFFKSNDYAFKGAFALMAMIFSAILFMMPFYFMEMLEFYDEHITASSVILIFSLVCQSAAAVKIKFQ